MKYLAIPDVHGRDKWKAPCKAFREEHPDGFIIFLGDYNDAYGISDEDMVNNFADIILFKEQNPSSVILLLGNHCFPYLSHHYSCSGNRHSIWNALHLLYTANLHLFQLAYQDGNTLFVHAGLAKNWLEYNSVLIERQVGGHADINYAGMLNSLFNSPERALLYQVGRVHGGYDAYDGPLWVRPSQLLNDLPLNLHQVVGHTHMPHVVKEERGDSSVTFTDCMGNADWQPLIIDL